MPRTFDNRGRLLGDDSTDDTMLPEIDVTAAALPAATFANLLQPPNVYFLVAGIALLAYWMDRK